MTLSFFSAHALLIMNERPPCCCNTDSLEVWRRRWSLAFFFVTLTNVYEHVYMSLITVISNFSVPPSVIVPIQVVGAPVNAEVVLECFVQASPRPLNYWTSGEGRNPTSSYVTIKIRHAFAFSQLVARARAHAKSPPPGCTYQLHVPWFCISCPVPQLMIFFRRC